MKALAASNEANYVLISLIMLGTVVVISHYTKNLGSWISARARRRN